MNKLISNTWIWLVEYEEQDKKISKVQLVHIQNYRSSLSPCTIQPNAQSVNQEVIMWRRVEMGNETIVEKGCRSGKKTNDGRTKQIVQRNGKSVAF